MPFHPATQIDQHLASRRETLLAHYLNVRVEIAIRLIIKLEFAEKEISISPHEEIHLAVANIFDHADLRFLD